MQYYLNVGQKPKRKRQVKEIKKIRKNKKKKKKKKKKKERKGIAILDLPELRLNSETLLPSF